MAERTCYGLEIRWLVRHLRGVGRVAVIAYPCVRGWYGWVLDLETGQEYPCAMNELHRAEPRLPVKARRRLAQGLCPCRHCTKVGGRQRVRAEAGGARVGAAG